MHFGTKISVVLLSNLFINYFKQRNHYQWFHFHFESLANFSFKVLWIWLLKKMLQKNNGRQQINWSLECLSLNLSIRWFDKQAWKWIQSSYVSPRTRAKSIYFDFNTLKSNLFWKRFHDSISQLWKAIKTMKAIKTIKSYQNYE